MIRIFVSVIGTPTGTSGPKGDTSAAAGRTSVIDATFAAEPDHA
jgi:hypothetical protein